MSKKSIEVVTFRTNPALSDEAVVSAANGIVPWLRQQKGFLARSFGRNIDGAWIDCVTWQSFSDAKAAAADIMNADGAGPFMQAIVAESVTMRHYDVELEL